MPIINVKVSAKKSPVVLNGEAALRHRRDAGSLTWRGPALMLFARTAFAVGAKAVFAAGFALRGSPSP